jgi:ABC-type transporter Mla maintaining outer membrane lipid asymmetry permease subunit MlaE
MIKKILAVLILLALFLSIPITIGIYGGWLAALVVAGVYAGIALLTIGVFWSLDVLLGYRR